MKICKATGLVKYGNKDEAKAGPDFIYSKTVKTVKCEHCHCLHNHVVGEKSPKKVETKGTGNWTHVDVTEIVAETHSALLLRIKDEEYWIPKSQIADTGDYKEGDTDCVVSITDWIANEKGIA